MVGVCKVVYVGWMDTPNNPHSGKGSTHADREDLLGGGADAHVGGDAGQHHGVRGDVRREPCFFWVGGWMV